MLRKRSELIRALPIVLSLYIAAVFSYKYTYHEDTHLTASTHDNRMNGKELDTISSEVDSLRADVGVVVSFCNEPDRSVEQIESHMKMLRDNSSLSVRAVYYCKCSAHIFCDFYLPNIGREGQTFLLHILNNYRTLNSVTVFVNAGFFSKPINIGTGALKGIFDELAQAYAEPRPKVSLLDFYGDADKFSWDDKTGLLNDFVTPVDCAVTEEFCSVDANRCIVDDLPCEGHSRCACFPQSNCTWSGSTRENAVFTRGHLQPAVNEKGAQHTMFTWACTNLYLTPSKISTCGYSWGALFAAGKNRLQRLQDISYHMLVREFDLYGASGGLAGHYLERLWRSMYLC